MTEIPFPTSACLGAPSFWSPRHIMHSGWLGHAPFAFWLVSAVKPQTIVELGTYAGFSYFAFCQAVQQLDLPTACYGIDTWKGDEHAGFYGEEVYSRLSALNDQHYAGFSRLLRCRFNEALSHFPDGSVDVLHIDGRHGYEDVSEDFESWRPKLSSQSIVLFHDTNVRERDFGVWKFWSELSNNHPSFEFLHSHGLGVLAVGNAIPKELEPLFDASSSHINLMRNIYGRLGQTIRLQYQVDEAKSKMGNG